MRDSALELLPQSCRDAARAAPGNLDRPGSTGGSPWRTKLSALVALVVLAAVAVSAGSAKRPAASFTHKTLDAPTAVVPPTGKVAGHGYAYWMQRRWQWAYSLSGPSSTSSPCHPLTANGKQVTFLSVPRSTGSYSCRQPAGRPIYVNLVSVVCDTLVPGEHPRFGTSDAQLQLCSKSYFTGAGTPSATVDGHAVNFKGLLVATGGFPPPRALWQPVRCSTSSVSQAAANAEPEPAARERDGKGPQRDEHAERFNCRAPETRKAPRGAFRQRSRLRATGSSGGRCRGRRSASPPCPSA